MFLDTNRLTHKSQEAIVLAQHLAEYNGNCRIEPEHLLLALLEQYGSIVPSLFDVLHIDVQHVTQKARDEIESLPRSTGSSNDIAMSLRLRAVMGRARAELRHFGAEYIATEHLLLALADHNADRAHQILHSAGVTRDQLTQALRLIRSRRRTTAAPAERPLRPNRQWFGQRTAPTNARPEPTALTQYSLSLHELARAGKLDPVVGRDEEIQRVIHILSRRTKNNPVLIGEPGVGKTAIAEGLAQRIASGDVPKALQNQRVIALNLGSMLGGAKYRGEFEDRLQAVLREVQEHRDIILFVDELHTLVGAGAATGALDAGNMLKPMLARGELHLIGATTISTLR